MVELGDRVRDIVTGMQGVAIGITKWITGCDTVTFQPSLKADGSKPDTEFVDINRLVIIEKAAVSISRHKPERDSGGPQTHGAPSKNPHA